MTDSSRTSASTDRLTKAVSHEVEHGTPVGHPTPTGEPDTTATTEQPDLFPGARQIAPLVEGDAALLQAVGRIILAWGHLERTTADKVAAILRGVS